MNEEIDMNEGLTIDDWYKMNHHDWKDVVNEHNDLLAEVKDLQKKLDNLREYCHAEGYDIFNWEVKNIEVIE